MIVGTRGSQLALAQTKQVCADLSKLTKEDVDVEIIKTKGETAKYTKCDRCFNN